MTLQQEETVVADVVKTVTVIATPDEVFDTFVTRPLDWWPETHVFVEDRVAIVIEPFVGGRYYEVSSDGTEIDWGRVREWDAGRRLVLTWRVGPGWQPVYDDEIASFIELDLAPGPTPGTTQVSLTHSSLGRHGEIAGFIHSALDGPSPGETLGNLAAAVESGGPAGAVTLVNRFHTTVSHEEFSRTFDATSQYFSGRPGFIEHTLHRSAQDEGTYVNIARWRSSSDLKRATEDPEFLPHAQKLRAMATSEPEVFRPLLRRLPTG